MNITIYYNFYLIRIVLQIFKIFENIQNSLDLLKRCA